MPNLAHELVRIIDMEQIVKLALCNEKAEYHTINGWVEFSPQDMPLRHLVNLCTEYPVRINQPKRSNL